MCFFMHSASAVDIYRAQRKHINYSICSGVTGGCQGVQWRGGRTLGPPDKNEHKNFDSTFLGFLERCFNLGEKYNISGNFLGVSGKTIWDADIQIH
jgi:hypothetical protein